MRLIASGIAAAVLVAHSASAADAPHHSVDRADEEGCLARLLARSLRSRACSIH